MNGAQIRRQLARPFGKDFVDGLVVVDREREVEIGPPVAGPVREPTHDRACDDPSVGLGESEHALADTVPVVDGEHAPMLADRADG